MRDPTSRLQHQAGDPAYGDDGPYTAGIDNNEGPIDDVELATLDEHDRRAVANRDRLGRRQSDLFGHVSGAPQQH